MKFFIVAALAFVACVAADVSELGYNYHEPAQSAPAPVQSFAPEQSYIAPAPQAPVQHYSAPAPVQHYAPEPAAAAPVQSYAAPAQSYAAPAQSYSAPVAAASSDDGYNYDQPQSDQGYRYKTVRRVVYRHRA